MVVAEDLPSDVLEDVAYLARSPNRVSVLVALVSEPRSTRALREATGTSKTTLNRILNEFDERSWARRTADGHYDATPQGEHVAIQFCEFLESMSVIRDFGEDIAVLPADEMTVGTGEGLPLGLGELSDATVKRQPPEAQGVGREELLAAARESSSMTVLTDMAPPRSLRRIIEDRALSEQLSGSLVCTTGLVEYFQRNPEQPPAWRKVLDAGFELYRYKDTVPANIAVFDDTTFIWGAAGEMRRRVIISRNEHVRAWAVDVVGRCRECSDPLDSEVFA